MWTKIREGNGGFDEKNMEEAYLGKPTDTFPKNHAPSLLPSDLNVSDVYNLMLLSINKNPDNPVAPTLFCNAYLDPLILQVKIKGEYSGISGTDKNTTAACYSYKLNMIPREGDEKSCTRDPLKPDQTNNPINRILKSPDYNRGWSGPVHQHDNPVTPQFCSCDGGHFESNLRFKHYYSEVN